MPPSSSSKAPGVWNAASGPRVLTEAQRQRKRERDRNNKREEKAKQQQRMQELEEAKNSASRRVQELEAQLENCCCKSGGAARLETGRCQSSVHVPTTQNSFPQHNYPGSTYQTSDFPGAYLTLNTSDFGDLGPGTVPWGDMGVNPYQNSRTSSESVAESSSAASYFDSPYNDQSDQYPETPQTSFEDPEPRAGPYNASYSGVSNDQPCFSPAPNHNWGYTWKPQ